MGRRKISIAPISDDRNRQVTFLKRKNGLFKKAYELGVLCSADVAVVVFNANGKLFEFGSGDLDSILLRYSHYAGPPHEKKGPQDYVNKEDMLLAAANAASAQSAAGAGGPIRRKPSVASGLGDDDDEDDDGEGEDDGDGDEHLTGTDRDDMASSGATTARGAKGKGKQALVAAKAREMRHGSAAHAEGGGGGGASIYPPTFPPPPPASHPHPHHSTDPSSSASSSSANLFPTTTLNPPPSGQPFYPAPLPNPFQLPMHHQHQMQAPFFPPYPPPPPNPAELFQMGLFGGNPPLSLPQSSSASSQFQPNAMFAHQNSNAGTGPGPASTNASAGPGFGSMNHFNLFAAAANQHQQMQQQGQQGPNPNAGEGALAALNYFNSGMLNPAPAGGQANGGFTNFFGGGGGENPNSSAGGGGGGGGVPNWFGAQNPMVAAAAVAASLQQQQHHQPQHLDRSDSVHPHEPPRAPSRAAAASRRDSVIDERPTSRVSSRSRHRSPTRQDSNNSMSSTNGGSGPKPRLNIAIPTSSAGSLEEGRKVGLVTAGGASILGKGINGLRGGGGADANGEGGFEEGDRDDDDDEDSQPTAVPRSAFASDLLAAQSPFYPNHHPQPNPYNFPIHPGGAPATSTAAAQSFYQQQFGNWPGGAGGAAIVSHASGFRPAPMLGESDAPDLIRDSPDPLPLPGEPDRDQRTHAGGGGAINSSSEDDAVRRTLKRGSVDLEEAIEGLEVDESQDEREGGVRKRRA